MIGCVHAPRYHGSPPVRGNSPSIRLLLRYAQNVTVGLIRRTGPGDRAGHDNSRAGVEGRIAWASLMARWLSSPALRAVLGGRMHGGSRAWAPRSLSPI